MGAPTAICLCYAVGCELLFRISPTAPLSSTTSWSWYTTVLGVARLSTVGWSEEHNRQFEKCKVAISHQCILKHRDPSMRLFLYTDVSDSVWSGIVTQAPQHLRTTVTSASSIIIRAVRLHSDVMGNLGKRGLRGDGIL